jgi:DHA1 family bicyclomycin/chloramphenicol resistance-like MFS transporter
VREDGIIARSSLALNPTNDRSRSRMSRREPGVRHGDATGGPRIEASAVDPRGVRLWVLALITLSGTLAMHMFVPALAQAARDLAVSPTAIQSTISLYILGLAVGQLVYGPISDHLGRRPALLFGLSLFTVAGIACMAATSVGVLVAARFAQALGGCSGLLLGRAIVRDTSNAAETMHRLAALQLITMIGPGVAPLIGALIATAFGWRWIFAFFVALGVTGLVVTWRLLPETRASRDPGTPRSLRADYALLVRSPAFLGCVVGGGCATTSLYAFITAAPFMLVERFGQSTTLVGVSLFVLIAGAGVGNVISRRLAARVSLMGAMLTANILSLTCAVLLVLQLALGIATMPGVMAAMFLYCVGAGLCSPAVVTKAMSVQPSVAGSAAGIYGCAQMVVGAACTAAVGLGHDPGLSAAVVLVVASLIASACFQVVRRSS